ncbi:MAG TPA: DUF6134 family protein [Flavisolibacter sp.]|nr:DUF6134 family protein [Flavisolibacter sp.]
MNSAILTSPSQNTGAAERRCSHADQTRLKCVLMWVAVLLFGASIACTQEQVLNYVVNRQGKKVGDLHFKQVREGEKTVYSIESLVKVSILFSFTIQAWEQSVYEHNALQSSSLVRKVNGKERDNKQITNKGNSLSIVSKGGAQQVMNCTVNYSTHCLYTTEPLQYSRVFSDNYQQFLTIHKQGDHHYQITFPDGNSNDYYYENGICRRMTVSSMLFDAEFILLKAAGL